MPIELIIFIALISSTIFLGGYTANFQESTLLFGKKLAPDNEFLPTGFQDTITPKAQNIRNTLFAVLLVIVLIYGIIFFQWWRGILYFSLTFFLGIPIAKLLLPKPGSDYYYRKIKSSLLKRRENYNKIQDNIRVEAINEVIKKFDSLEIK